MAESFYYSLNTITDKDTVIQEYTVNCVSIGKLWGWREESFHPLTPQTAIFLQWKLNTFPRNVLTVHFKTFSCYLCLPVTAEISPFCWGQQYCWGLPKQQIRLWYWVQATAFWQERLFHLRYSGKFGLVKISLNSFVLFKDLIHLLYFKFSRKWIFKATFHYPLYYLYCPAQLLCWIATQKLALTLHKSYLDRQH